ncbi:DUF3325 family protein [Pseudoduganella namucuonensis]|uniref:DUF3325 family protein n=1 Tax=Pseudoduganella namucuonensis TaxID=1035707 RepID=A0A1I7LN33_9BURK|nr:DUF3325 family protein [Pseudoduganella namucuonensis]SFV11020.1 Protein of unknown function [Pseudoduganella namucuonensis]
MPESLMLFAALALILAGAAWLALSLESHWRQVRGDRAATPSTVRLLRVLGALALGAGLLLCLRVDHTSMAALVWVMALAAAALAVAFTLSWRPRLLAPLVAWIRH